MNASSAATENFGGLPRWRRFSGEHRLALRIAAGLFLIYAAFLAPGIYSQDGNSMLAVSESLAKDHSFVVPANLGSPGVGGRIYSHWYLLLSVLGVPFTYAALQVSRVTGLPFHYLAAVFVLPLICAVTAATSAVVALVTLRLGGSTKGAWLAAMSFGLGTIALAYMRTFFADPLLALVVVSALYFALGRSPRDILLAACLAALAVLSKPTGVLVGPILTAYLLARRVRMPGSLLPVTGTAVGFGIAAAYNVLRFGQALDFGYTLPFRLDVFPAGVVGLLAAPGCGLVWYCPPVILAILGFRKALEKQMLEALAVAAVFTAFLCVHAMAWFWYGGWSWGPRYLLPGIPGLCALLGLVAERWKRTAIVLMLLGFAVNAPTLFSFYERYYAELLERGVYLDERFAWSFRDAPFLHAWPAAVREVQDATALDPRKLSMTKDVPDRTIASSRALRIVAVWWWVLPVAHVPRWIGFLFAMFLAILGSLVLVGDQLRPWRALPEQPPALAL